MTEGDHMKDGTVEGVDAHESIPTDDSIPTDGRDTVGFEDDDESVGFLDSTSEPTAGTKETDCEVQTSGLKAVDCDGSIKQDDIVEFKVIVSLHPTLESSTAESIERQTTASVINEFDESFDLNDGIEIAIGFGDVTETSKSASVSEKNYSGKPTEILDASSTTAPAGVVEFGEFKKRSIDAALNDFTSEK